METPVDKTTKENWKEVIPHRENVYLQGSASIFYGRIHAPIKRGGANQTTKQGHEQGGADALVAHITNDDRQV